MLTFGERIGIIRRRRAMTQKDLGEKAGVHPNTIARLERGKLKSLPGPLVAQIARVLRCRTDYLLGLSERDELDSEVKPTGFAMAGT
jgi:transcriptional regulator with XRE-family HTH domain